MIELVIKISEEDYDTLINHNNDSLTATIARLNLWKALENAAVIPDGHGRIGDVDKLHNMFKKTCKAYSIDKYLSFMSEVDMNFDLASIIVEADKGNEK